MRRVNVAVIGCGYIAEHAHIPNALSLPESKLIAVADIDEERLKVVSKRFNIKNVYADYEKLLERSDVEAVIICTPTNTHAKIALASIEAGKHVFIEKPMASSVEDCKRIVEASKRSGVKVMVGMQHRFLANHRVAKRMIKRGDIGGIIYAEAHAETLTIKPEDGILLDYAVHLIDLILWYLDDLMVEKVAGFLHEIEKTTAKETGAILTLLFSNGLFAQIKAYWLRSISSWSAVDRYVKVIGTKGKIISELTGPSLMVYREGSLLNRLRGPYRIMPPKIINPYIPLTDSAYRLELEHFLECIIRNREPEINASEGLRVLQIVEAARRSFDKGLFVSLSEI